MILFDQKTVDIPKTTKLYILKRIIFLVFKYFLDTEIQYQNMNFIILFSYFYVMVANK